MQSKKPDAAEWQAQRLAAISPGDPREAALRAWIISDRSRPVEAASALEQAYSLREGTPGAETLGREVFTRLTEMGEETGPVAERVGRKIAKKTPSASWMPAMIAARRGRGDEAFELLQPVLRPGANPDDLKEAAKVAMKVAIAAGDSETLRKAGQIIDAILQLAPDVDEILVMSAMLRHVQGHFEEEVRLYRKIQSHRPENYVVLNNLAWALSEGLNRPEEGLACVDELIKTTGRDPEALDTRGVILTRLKRFDEAVKDLEEVIRAAPNGLHHFHLARAYSRAGQTADALKNRDLAKAAGLALEGVDASERADLKALLEMK
jgi:tetratricopeptide (TPR) repeat protein